MSLLPSLWGQSLDKDPFRSLQQDMNRLFESFGRGMPADWGGVARGFLAPTIDVAETDAQITVTVELPGVAEEDMHLSLVDNILTIQGEKKAEETKEDEGKKYRHVERSYGSFQRSIPLAFRADVDSVKASFKDGVLKITVPKPAGAEPKSSRIPIGKA